MAQGNKKVKPSSPNTKTLELNTGTVEHKEKTVTDLDDERKKLIREEVLHFYESIANVKSPQSSKIPGSPIQQVENEEQTEGVEDYCREGEIVGNRFKVISKFREGGFGQIYKAFDTTSHLLVALKVEKLSATTESMEISVLRKFQNHSHCPCLYGSGTTSKYSFMALQLLGKNLSELRKLCLLHPTRLSVSSSVRVTYQCLEAVEALQNLGFLHRDIKPSNFAIGGQQKDRGVVYMLDFGLARYYLNRDGSHRTERKHNGFRGTLRYASINAHLMMDLSRRDDLWSLFYSFYELMIGNLHWRKSNDRNIVRDMKMQLTPEIMCVGLPSEVVNFVSLIRRLKFEDKPYYEQMYNCLKHLMTGIKAKFTDLYDWQVLDCRVLYHWFRFQAKPK